MFVLTRVIRQQGDKVFIKLLNELRFGRISSTAVRTLRNRTGKKPRVPVSGLTALFPLR